ncbi:hypothetical protein D3C72_1933560 [compost metagenome]
MTSVTRPTCSLWRLSCPIAWLASVIMVAICCMVVVMRVRASPPWRACRSVWRAASAASAMLPATSRVLADICSMAAATVSTR